MKKIYIQIFCFFISVQVSSQNCFESFYQEGKKAYNELNFEKALNQFEAAINCDDLPLNSDIEDWIDKTKDGYIQEILAAKKTAEANLEKVNNLANTYDFFEGKYAKAYGRIEENGEELRLYGPSGEWIDKFHYFIDKNGNEVQKLGRWLEVSEFDKFGFIEGVKVSIDTVVTYHPSTNKKQVSIVPNIDNTRKILTDTSGISYILSTELSAEYEVPTAYYNNPNIKIFIPDYIMSNNKVEILVLESKMISSIPQEIDQLKHLKHLRITNCTIGEIPKNIEKLKNLEVLDLSNTHIKEVPETIFELKKLKYLNLSNCKIESISPSLNKLENLEYLNIGNWEVNFKDLEFKNLNKLKFLGISDITRTSFDNNTYEEIVKNRIDLVLSKFNPKGIEVLDLSYNNVDKFPENLKEFKNLKKIILKSQHENIDFIKKVKEIFPNCKIIEY